MRRFAAPVASLILLVASSPARAAWSTDPLQNTPVSLASGNQRQPGMTPDGLGGAFIVFRDTRDSASTGVDLYAQHLDLQGKPLWAIDGVPVVTKPGQQTMDGLNPSAIAADGVGGAFVVFTSAPALFGSYAWVNLQHLDENGTALWGDSGIAVSSLSSSQINQRVLADGTGGAFVSWSMANSGGDHRIMAQHFGAGGTPLWTPDGVTVCSSTIPQGQRMVPDGSGGLVLAWEDFRVFGGSDIYAQRVDATGVAQWATNGVPLSTASGQQLGLRMCSDGAGGAIVAWYDYDSSRVFAGRVTGAGAAIWTTDGVRLCAHAGAQLSPKIVSDGAGGGIVGWYDLRSGSTSDYYLQRLDGSGARLWGDDALPLCTAPGGQSNLEVIPDGEHGAIAVWADDRVPGTRNLYAQRVGPAGNPLWAVDGILVGGAEPGSQDQPAIVASGGGVIVAFADWRGTSTDLYAQQFSLDGLLAVAVVGVEPGERSREPHGLAVAPLPARVDVTFSFDARSAGPVLLDLFDLQGRRLRRLGGRTDPPGVHHLRWDLRDEAGRPVGAGIYLARLGWEGEVHTARVVVVE